MRTVVIITETTFDSPITTSFRTDKTILEIKEDIDSQMHNKYVHIPNEKDGTLSVFADKIKCIRITDTIITYY
jgi:hypothetical protein